jgi:hypothetical protein
MHGRESSECGSIAHLITIGYERPLHKTSEGRRLRAFSGCLPDFETADHPVFARKGVGELKANGSRESNVPSLNELRPAAHNVHTRGEAIALDSNW